MKIRTTSHQQEMMLTFMEEYGDISRAPANATERIEWIIRWEELTNLLNNEGSGTKSTDKWKKVWSDYKNNLKRKVTKLLQAANGSDVLVKLSKLEQRALNIIAAHADSGLPVDEDGFLQLFKSRRVPFVFPSAAVSGGSPAESGHDEDSCELESSNQPEQSMRVDSPVPTDFLATAEDESQGARVGAGGSQSTPAPALQPAVSGQTPNTTPRQTTNCTARQTPNTMPRHARPTRSSLHRRTRPYAIAQTERAAEHFRQSDENWREFRRQQHRDEMELKKEKLRIREIEVQGWQRLGNRALDLLEKVVSKYCDK